MSKERPISMRCTQEQFDSIKDRIPYEIYNIGTFENYPNLTNFYHCKKLVSNQIAKGNEHHETFNVDIFLEACGVEIIKKYAVKLTPAIKAWIKEEFGIDYYDKFTTGFFHWHKSRGINDGNLYSFVQIGYTEVSEQEFLGEFGKPKPIIQTRIKGGEWVDVIHQDCYRIKPTPDYSKEIDLLQEKAKLNGMKAVVTFEKL